MNSHSLFKGKGDDSKDNSKKVEELVQDTINNIITTICNKMKQEFLGLVDNGMPIAEARHLVVEKQKRLQQQALYVFEAWFNAEFNRKEFTMPIITCDS